MGDDVDDFGLLTAAAQIWRTPHKQRVLKDLSDISPTKRQGALQAKIFNLTDPSPPLPPLPPLPPPPPSEPSEEEDAVESEEDEAERQRPPQSSPPAGSRVRESSLLIRSDTPGRTEGSGWDTEDDVIKEGGALTKQRPIGSRVSALSGRPRWTMKEIPESEKATRTIMFTALTLDYINEGPPPPDAERDSRLTNDSRMRDIIETRYRQAYPDDFSLLGGIEIEAVVFPDKIEVL